MALSSKDKTLIRNKQNYYLNKSRGICVVCRKNKAVPGRVHCPYCALAQTNKLKKYFQEHPEICKRNNQKRYKLYKENGQCARCGYPLPEDRKRLTCQNCSEERIMGAVVFNPTRFYPGGKYENFNKGSA